jgi:hypothetical protein
MSKLCALLIPKDKLQELIKKPPEKKAKPTETKQQIPWILKERK